MASRFFPGLVLRTPAVAAAAAAAPMAAATPMAAKRKHAAVDLTADADEPDGDDPEDAAEAYAEPRPVREGLVDTRAAALVDVRLKTQRTLTAGACHLDAFYHVPKSVLAARDFERVHKSKLVIVRKGAAQYGGAPLVAYAETPTHYVLPRFYGLTHFGACPDRTTAGAPMAPGVAFCGALREGFPPQRQAADLILAHLRDPGAVKGCTVVMPCGTGKTVLMLYTVVQLGRRAGIVLPDVSLIDQTRKAIETFFPAARIGLVHRKKFVVDGTDIVLLSLKTLIHAKATFTPAQFDSIGTLWVDEAHHMTATQFVKTFALFNARCVGGQTATLRRRDGTAHALQWFMGPKVLQVHRSHERVRVLRLYYGATRELRFRNGSLNMPGMHTAIARDAHRSTVLVRGLLTALRGHAAVQGAPGLQALVLRTAPEIPAGDLPRTAIVLVHRKVHAYFLLRMLAEIVGAERSCEIADNGFCECILSAPHDADADADEEAGRAGSAARPREMLLTTLLGDFKPAQRARAKQGDVIFATYNMAQEGLDIPRVDTVVLGTPKSDVEQSVGRAEREHATKAPPLIIDLTDTSVGLFQYMAGARRDFYADGLMQHLKLQPDLPAGASAPEHLRERLLRVAQAILARPLPPGFTKEDPEDDDQD